jgi:hypothetical protein
MLGGTEEMKVHEVGRGTGIASQTEMPPVLNRGVPSSFPLASLQNAA